MQVATSVLSARGRCLGVLFGFLCLLHSVNGRQWPYDRFHSVKRDSGLRQADTSRPTFDRDAGDEFARWLRGVVAKDTTGELAEVFKGGQIPRGITVDNLIDAVHLPSPDGQAIPPVLQPPELGGQAEQATSVLKNLRFPLEEKCISEQQNWWYRSYDGSCNWIKQNQSWYGQTGTAKARDYDQTYYADGVSKPREGPNPRAVSNAFFKRKKKLYYEHTPLLIGLVEFIMHDVTYSQDSDLDEDKIVVPMPPDEEDYPLNTTFEVWRSMADPKSGTSPQNPRQILNEATTWLDISALYGSTKEVADKLRTHKGGKLISQRSVEIDRPGEYLPFNTMNVPMKKPARLDPAHLFAGGDPRTNEDWILLAVHTLLLREHNRLCGVLAKRKPEIANDDERLYQTVRLLMSAKYAMIANSYQMAYWDSIMPWPRDDGFPLYRQMYGANALKINPANTYPWPLVTKGDKPMIVSAEMSVVYRFHEFIISSFPIKDRKNNTSWEQDLFQTAFNATGFLGAGLESILRGVTATSIPNFKSGVDEAFRSAGSRHSKGYMGKPFDIVTWSIVHEREQGLPTFNNYFRKYNEQNPDIKVPIRKTFAQFSNDTEAVAQLKKLYATPNDVDLVVGVQLDEAYFPGTTVPLSALIVSLFSLFGMGNSDRFSIGFAMMRCFLVDKPWDCHPSNALEDILWAPSPTEDFPNLRMIDPFWVTELDLQAHGTNLLWRLITENSMIQCIQHNPLFPYDKVTNPILCELPKDSWWYSMSTILLSASEVLLALMKQGPIAFLGTLSTGLLFLIRLPFQKKPKLPSLGGWPLIGVAIQFQSDPLKLFTEGMQKFGGKAFGLKLGSLTNYVVTRPEDFNPIANDPYELRFSLHDFFKAINFDLITLGENFESDLHTQLIRNHLSNPEVLKQLARVIDHAAKEYLKDFPLIPEGKEQVRLPGLNSYFSRFIAYVMSRCIVGPFGYDNETLLNTFVRFNDDAISAMGRASLLPRFLRFIPKFTIQRDFNAIRKILIPQIKKRRDHASNDDPDFMNYTMQYVDNDQRVADLIAIATWVGLTNLQATFSSSAWDIINTTSLQQNLDRGKKANPADLSILERQEPWSAIRSAVFESIRLCGPIIGPARIVKENYSLPSESSLSVPRSQVITLSSYHRHRQQSVWGNNAALYNPQRFTTEDPPIGTDRYITWGLKTPHICPGRWFGLEVIQILILRLFSTYTIVPDSIVPDADKYQYNGGSVMWKDIGVTVRKNSE